MDFRTIAESNQLNELSFSHLPHSRPKAKDLAPRQSIKNEFEKDYFNTTDFDSEHTFDKEGQKVKSQNI